MWQTSTIHHAVDECLEIARATNESDTRARLVSVAGKLLDLAEGKSDGLGVLIDGFNRSQMLPYGTGPEQSAQQATT